MFRFIITFLVFCNLVAGHAFFQELWVDGKDQATSCIRMPKSNSPVKDVMSPDMRCNAGGSVGVPGICDAQAGANLTVEMHQQPNDRKCSNEAIGGRHFGPVMIYMCAVPDAKTATGDCSWVKMSEDTYAGSDASWGTEILSHHCGKKSFILPPSLKAGNYLVRAEAVALHTAGSPNGAQFYMSCYQVNVKSTGTQVLPKGVSFPGAYKSTDPGILVDIYQNQGSYGKKKYIAPGPEVWNFSAGAANPKVSAVPVVPASPKTPAMPVPASPKTSAMPVPAKPKTPAMPAAVSPQMPAKPKHKSGGRVDPDQ